MDERRFPRWQVRPEEAGCTVDCDGSPVDVLIVDIGAGGVRLRLGRPVTAGSRIDMSLDILHEVMARHVPYRAEGRVVRVVVHQGYWESGVCFDEVKVSPH